MIERRTARRGLLSAASVLAAVVAVGCVAAPGASSGPTASTAPSTPPTAAPTLTPSDAPTATPSSTPTAPPSASPSAVPSPSAKPSTATCGVSTWSKGANDIVLRMTVAGGFVPPGVDQTNVPVISIYGDGRVISPGAQIMIYPGPLLPSLQVQNLDDAGMRKLLDAAAAAGLLVPDVTYEQHSVADAPTTFFTLTADGCTHHVNADALMVDESGQGLDQKTTAARIKLGKFRDALADLTTLVGKDSITDVGVFVADSFRIIVREDPASATASGAPAIKWPLATPLATFGEKLGQYIEERCGVVDGADATTLQPLFDKANAETHWSSRGKSYYLRVRPLLPDESGCGDKIV